MEEYLLLGLVSIIALGVLAQWLAWRLHFPAILLLLLAGIFAGPITGFLNPDQLLGPVLQPIVSISVAIILFEGGLSLRLRELKEIGNTVLKLITIGMLVTWGLTFAFAYWLLELNLELSVLIGAILIVTGPTVIIPLMRQVRPSGKVGAILKWEGIVIDPIGAMMAVLVFEVILAGGLVNSGGQAVMSIVNTLAFGLLLGLLGAIFIYYLLKRHLIPDFLQNSVALMAVITLFAVSNMLQHESGLLTVTIMGIALANQRTVRVKHIIDFKEDLRVLLISALFIMLASRLKLEHLEYLDWQAILFLVILIIVVRPAAVFLSTMRSNLNVRERLFLSWMAPRGIVAAAISAIFALRLADIGYEQAGHLIPYTFLIIIGTVTIYGSTASFVARKLKLAKPSPRGLMIVGGHPWAQDLALQLHHLGLKVIIADSNWDNIARVRKAGLEAYYGNVLAEYAMEEIKLDGIGRLLALTHNDEVNSLAVLRYSEIFGSSEVYQLPPITLKPRKEREVPDEFGGRILFNSRLNFDSLNQLYNRGAYFENHKLEKKDQFKELVGDENLVRYPLFLVGSTGAIQVFATDEEPEPEAGQHVITLTLPSKLSSETEFERS